MSDTAYENIIEGIQSECRRVREELIPRYVYIGQAGAFGRIALEESAKECEAAIASGDTVRKIAALQSLQVCE